MQRLSTAYSALGATVLDPEAPPTPAVAKAFDKENMQETKERLSGALGKTAGGAFVLFGTKSAAGTTTPAKVMVTRTGGTDYAARTHDQVQALGVEHIVYGVVVEDGTESGITIGGLAATLTPTDAGIGNELAQLTISIEGSDPQDMDIEDAVKVAGLKWQPWEGAPGGPPPIPAATGIIAEGAAYAADLPCASITGQGGAAPMRSAVLASLGVIGAAGDARVTIKAMVAFAGAHWSASRLLHGPSRSRGRRRCSRSRRARRYCRRPPSRAQSRRRRR
jgi:hypothetical protein